MTRDVACQYCGDTFSTQGIRLHEKHCDERDDDRDDRDVVDDDPDDRDDVVDGRQVLGADRDDRDDVQGDRDDVDPDCPFCADGPCSIHDDVDDEPDEPVRCPQCGNPDDDVSPRVYAADTALARFFQEQGRWNPEVDRLIHRSDAWCANCHSFLIL